MADAKIKITAETSQAQQSIDKLDNSLNNLDSTAKKGASGLDNLGSTAKVAGAAFAALSASIGIRQIVDYSNRWTDLNSRLVNATGSQKAASAAMDSISKSARTTFSDLETTADVFIRNSMALNEMGVSTATQVKVSEALNNAMAVSGARGAQAANALDAFAKSVARGKLDGEAFNSIVSTSPRLIKALADGLGVTTKEFRNMIGQGEITTNKMIPALLKEMGKLQKEAEAMPATIGDAFIVLNNKLFETIGSSKLVVAASGAISKGLLAVADNTGVLVGGAVGLTVAFIALGVSIAGVTASLAAMKVMLITTGVGAIVVGLGMALGYAAEKWGLFGDDAKKANDQAAAATNETFNAVSVLTAEQEKLRRRAVAAADASYSSLGQDLALIQAQNQGRGRSAEIEKVINNERQKLAANHAKMTPEFEKQYRIRLEELQTAKEESKINSIMRNLTLESVGLNSENADLKEINVAMSGLELEFQRQLTVEERDRLKLKFQGVQKSREEKAIREAIAKYERTAPVRRSERVTGGIDLMKQGNPYQEEMKAFEQNQLNLQALKDYYAQQGIDKTQEFKNAELVMEQAHQDRLTDISKNALQARLRAAGVTNQGIIQGQLAIQDTMQRMSLGQMSAAEGSLDVAVKVLGEFGKTSKSAFEASKRLAIAQAMIQTFGAVSAALKGGWMAGGPLGPFTAPIFAAMALASGMAQVAAIKSQQYSGRALGGPVIGGKPYLVGESGPELFTPSTTGSITRNSDLGQSQPVNVNFTIVANDTQGFDQLLASRKGVIQQIISDAMLEKGQRSMM